MKKYVSLFMLVACFALNAQQEPVEAPESNDEVTVVDDANMDTQNPSLFDQEGNCGCNGGKKK